MTPNADYEETAPGPAFWNKVDRGDCWEWQGEIGKGGYGIWYPGRPRYGTRYVHRIVWLAVISAIPAGYEVDHECFVRHCVKPSHLQLLTVAENRRTGRRNWRYYTDRCPSGHLKVGDNLVVTKDGHHRCRECDRLAWRKYDATRRVRG